MPGQTDCKLDPRSGPIFHIGPERNQYEQNIYCSLSQNTKLLNDLRSFMTSVKFNMIDLTKTPSYQITVTFNFQNTDNQTKNTKITE